MDEVRVWSVARTQAQILASKDVELVGNEANLALYVKANEGTGTALADAKGPAGVVRNLHSPSSATIAGRIDHAGQRDFYTFSLTESKLVYFDSLTNNSTLSAGHGGERAGVQRLGLQRL